MKILMVVFVALTGCSRELTGVTDRKAEPAYLGDMSGLYELSLVVEDDFGYAQEMPFGSRLQILHLSNPDGGDDLLLGIEEEPYFQEEPAFPGEEPGVGYERLFFDAGLRDNLFVGGSNKGPVLGKRVVGGGAVAIADLIPVCDNGPRYSIIGKLVCPVNPALSGVYGGEAASCDSGEYLGDKFLAVAFIDEAFLGHYPGSETVLEGYYNRYTEEGRGFSYGIDWETGGVVGSDLDFNLTEADGLLYLSGDVYAHSCTGTGVCTESCETLELARLIGGTSNDCYINDTAPAIGSATVRRDYSEDGRYLFVNTQFSQLPGGEPDASYASGVLRRADNPMATIAGEGPDHCAPSCPCDLDCCACDIEPWVCDEPNCDCDPFCGCACEVPDGLCNGDCRCDIDCHSSCDCNTDDECTIDCFCDPDCTCPCDRPPDYALRFPLPTVTSGQVVEYELFLSVYDPYFYEDVPTTPRCIIDDGGIDTGASEPPPEP